MQSSAVEAVSRRVSLGPAFLAHAIFVPTGIITVILGPLLPILAESWSLNDTQAGYLISAQFLGALVSTAGSSVLVPRLGFRRAIAGGQFLMALGSATLMSHGFAGGISGAFFNGAGIGLTIPTVNLMVAAANARRPSSALNLLNFSWSAGAVACPFIISGLQRSGRTLVLLQGLSGFLLVMMAILLVASPVVLQAVSRPHSSKQRFWPDLLRNPGAIVIGVLFFLYVGTENGLGAWMASYAKRASASGGTAWITIPSYFYAAILLGRALAPLTLQHVSDERQARFAATLGLVATAALLLSHSVPAIAVWAFVSGLGLSTLYPIVIGFMSSSFGPEAPRAAGVMFSLSTLGGASVPWLVGFFSTKVGSLRTALLAPLACIAVMLFLLSTLKIQQCSKKEGHDIAET